MRVERVERSIEIDAPPAAAFAAIVDWPRQAEWQPTLESVETTGDGGVGDGVGARLVEHRAGFGQHITFDLEVTEFEPPHRVRVSAKSRSRIHLAADEEFVVAPSGAAGGAGSVVTMAFEFELPLVLRPLAHGVGLEVGKQLEESLAALRDLVMSSTDRRAVS